MFIQEQYLFLHDGLVEFIRQDKTSHDCSEFVKQFRNVSVPQPNKDIMAILNKEFKVCNILLLSFLNLLFDKINSLSMCSVLEWSEVN